MTTQLNTLYHGKTVWLSGHTGFKGAWLAHWLVELGANVHGFALEPPTSPALFDQSGLAGRLHHQIGDLRDLKAVKDSLLAAQPDFVFHLGAQAIVRYSFDEPVETYATNVMGTIHVMEALRLLTKPCAAVLITTDKCYENREWVHGYREEDPLGGYDPYSSSKAAAEIAIASWRRSFFDGHPVRIASVRAGNVIGGGIGRRTGSSRIAFAPYSKAKPSLSAIKSPPVLGNMSWTRSAVICGWRQSSAARSYGLIPPRCLPLPSTSVPTSTPIERWQKSSPRCCGIGPDAGRTRAILMRSMKPSCST